MKRLLCYIGLHSWTYQRESFDRLGIGPNRLCLHCWKSQTWERGWGKEAHKWHALKTSPFPAKGNARDGHPLFFGKGLRHVWYGVKQDSVRQSTQNGSNEE